MIRILQLVGSDGGEPIPTAPTRISAGLGDGIQIVSRRIGCTGDYRSVAEAALALRYGDSAAADVIHAWDTLALIAAIAGRRPVVFSPPALTPRTLRALAWTMRFRSVDVVCATETERDILLERGMAGERCHVIRPSGWARSHPTAVGEGEAPAEPNLSEDLRLGGSLALPDPTHPTCSDRRQEIRRRLGIAPEDYVLLAPGESVYPADHRLAVHVGSILHVLQPRIRVLLWGRGPQARGAAELARRLDQPRLLICAQQAVAMPLAFAEIAAAADLALVTARQIAPVQPWVGCMAAKLPIVAADSPQTREVFADGAASIVEEPGPRTLANRVLALSENPPQARVLGEATARRTGEVFGQERFTREYLALYSGLCQGETAAGRESYRDSELSRMTVTGPSLTR